jgi:fatty acid desaturase
MEVNLDNWFKPKIDRKKLRDLSQRRDLPGLLHFFLYFLFLFISGYLAYIFWGTWWSLFFFFIYGTIYAFSVANWHETVHRTAFKTRWINELFYHISSFMCDFEGYRWRWSHTFHHTYTLQTEDDYDHEIQISRPTELFWFFLNYIPFTDLLYPHRLIKYEVLKHAFGKFTPVVNISAPVDQKKKIVFNSRLYVLIWLSVFVFSYYIGSILPILYIILPTYYGKPIWFAVNVTQHLGAAVDTKDHRLSTYSLKINPILSFLYWKMEYHLEHHMFPMVPSYNLKKIRNEIQDQIPKPFNSLYDFYKSVMPSVIKLATSPQDYYKVELKSRNK